MTTPRRKKCCKSFAELGCLLPQSGRISARKRKRGFEATAAWQHAEGSHSADQGFALPADCSDDNLFREVVGDVVPLRASGRKRRRRQRKKKEPNPDHGAAAALRTLVTTGQGFIVSQTPEYMEGRGYGVSPLLARRLHNGDFSVQAHVDLHGYGAQAAYKAVDSFLLESVGARRRVVLIIHGRGLSSPDLPVLKEKLREWLSTGRWGKWVLAFTSARAEDGGAGATYVLLRTKAVTKSQRRGCSFVK